MIDKTIAQLRARLEPLKLRAAKGELLFIEDLFIGLPDLPADVAAFHVDGHIGVNGKLDDISPGLSFLWNSDGIERFANAGRLRKSVGDFLGQDPGWSVKSLRDSDLLIRSSDERTGETFAAAMSEAIELLTEGSLNALNKYQDQIEAHCNDLAAAVARSPGGFGMLDLVAYIEKLTEADFGLMHLSNLWGSNRALTVLSASSSPESIGELAKFIGVAESELNSTGAVGEQPFPAVSLPQTVNAELIGNAAVWGKPLASLTESGKRILILPVTRPLVRREALEELGGIAAADLLFTFVDELSEWFMDLLKACVDTFSSYRYGARRFNLLAQLQSLQDQAIIEANDPRQTLHPFGTVDLEEVLSEVLYTTSAHSVSLRVYDPASRALVCIAAAIGEFDGAETRRAPVSILIRGNERQSVVVFTFLRATNAMPYVYLKRISPPITRVHNGRLKTDNRTFIPPAYKNQGLQAPFFARSLTRSEICFPLRQGALAFGTLNIEAPFPAAFDQDIDFLTLIKSALEQVYRSVGERIDGQWLIANAARSDSVHQLWQYQEEGTFFTKEQDSVLRAIFPPRTEHALTGSRALRALQTRIDTWMDHRYEDTLLDNVRSMVKFDHLSDIGVTALFAEAAYVVLRNIIQNAVKHGEPGEELIFVDDRSWFGSRATPCLRIYYRSSQPVRANLIEVLGSAPVVHDETDRVGFGMYNVGLITRLLGGNMYVSADPATAFLTIDVHLPISETSQ